MSAESEHQPRTAVPHSVWPVGEDNDRLVATSLEQQLYTRRFNTRNQQIKTLEMLYQLIKQAPFAPSYELVPVVLQSLCMGVASIPSLISTSSLFSTHTSAITPISTGAYKPVSTILLLLCFYVRHPIDIALPCAITLTCAIYSFWPHENICARPLTRAFPHF